MEPYSRESIPSMYHKIRSISMILITAIAIICSPPASASPLSDGYANLDRYVWFAGDTYAAATDAANDPNAGDLVLGGIAPSGDPAAYFGMDHVFDQVLLNISTPGSGG